MAYSKADCCHYTVDPGGVESQGSSIPEAAGWYSAMVTIADPGARQGLAVPLLVV
jgi:hypothetical protein